MIGLNTGMTHAEFTQLHEQLDTVLSLIDGSEHRFESTAFGELAESDYETIRRANSVLFRLGLWVKFSAGAEDVSYLLPKAAPVAALNPSHKNDGFVRT